MLETVAEIIGDKPAPKAEPFKPAALPDAPGLPAPGIYFGMPDELYHQLPALGSHGCQALLASPMIFWSKTLWLSQVARDQEKRKAKNPITQMTRIMGKAYHARILEGADEYNRRFACELTPEDCEGALDTTEEIKAAISAKGEKPVSKVPDELPDGTAFMRSAKKEDWVTQLYTLAPDIPILALLQEKHRFNNAGKQFIPAEAWDQIEIAAAMIEKDPQVSRAFMGGYPEVTLIWHCKETGVPMKARVDYLQLKAAVDLKSIANEHQSMEQAIRFAISRYRYNFQPSYYLEGIQAVKALVRAHFLDVITVCAAEDEQDIGAECAWAHKWAMSPDEPKWLWVFQSKGFAPVSRGVFYPTGGTTRMITDDMIKRAKRRFKLCSETFGTDPWVDTAPIYDLSDEDLPARATEI